MDKLHRARMVLSPEEFKKYEEWLEKPWVERCPYLASFILWASLMLNFVLIVTRIVK